MSRYQLFMLLGCMLMAVKGNTADFGEETYHYNISYKCSFVNEVAASATITVSCYDGTYNATLSGHSIPIFGTVYCINDTMQSQFIPSGVTRRPAVENVLYLSGYYRKPHDNDRTFVSAPSSYRTISGAGTLSASKSTMECVTLTADMLCIFYYAKTVEFDQMPLDEAEDICITTPDGRTLTLQIVYLGKMAYGDSQVYKLLCNYTYDGALSAYPITVLIDTETRIPMQISADIKIGKVAMIYSF